MALEQVRNNKVYELPLEDFRNLAPEMHCDQPPLISPDLTPIEVCQLIGEWYVAHSNEARRREAGQFFTPANIARYMANMAGTLVDHAKVLDPGSGVGILGCAICEAAITYNISALHVVAYESDPVLHVLCSFTLNYAREYLAKHGIELTFELHRQDFLEAMADQITQHSLWSAGRGSAITNTKRLEVING